jgi:hypothetical protein
MDSARQTAVVRELQALAHGKGIRSKNLDHEAPQFAELAGRCAPLLGAGTTVDVIDALVDRLAADGHLTFLQGTPLANRGSGADWAALLRMALNLDHSDYDLGIRRDNFVIPGRLQESYRITSVKSSKLRLVLEPAAFEVLVRMAESLGTAAAPTVAQQMQATEPIGEIRRLLRRLIASHGLNDESWSKAISSQYFVALLARRLQLTHRPDYQQLLNRFLESFAYRVDDSIVLNPEHVLVTSEEKLKIKEQMAAEDRRDAYYRQAAKTRAEEVSADDLHINYLYGLTLGITAGGSAKIIDTLRDVALAHLLDRNGRGDVLDLDGGWRPYRIPWLTARVLTSFAELAPELRSDQGTTEVLRAACSSLVDRLTPELTWRSGVGDWVSVWESTGLCLEGLLAHEDLIEDQLLLGHIGKATADRFNEWAMRPSFDTDDLANQTLASVIMASVLLRHSETLHLRLSAQTKREMEGLVVEALRLASETLEPQSRQFCTIPQVAYYATHIL